MTIEELAKEIRKENPTKERLTELYDITTDMLSKTIDARTTAYQSLSKKEKRLNNVTKESLWLLRVSIKYRLKK